jgi:uncharacterized membrane protein
VGYSATGSGTYAAEWSAGSVIDLGGLPGSTYSWATGINNVGQAVGFSIVDEVEYAVEWSGVNVIDLGGLPGSIFSEAAGINDAGQVVGYDTVQVVVAEPSTWAMMLAGFAGLGFAGYRRAKAGGAL